MLICCIVKYFRKYNLRSNIKILKMCKGKWLILTNDSLLYIAYAEILQQR